MRVRLKKEIVTLFPLAQCEISGARSSFLSVANALAQEKGLRVGGAPDTFFGGAWQTARKLIDQGELTSVNSTRSPLSSLYSTLLMTAISAMIMLVSPG